MRQTVRNVKLYATIEETGAMNIYLNYSGKRMYLMHHRYEPRLYYIMKDGVSLEELRRSNDTYKLYRWRRTSTLRRRSKVLENSIKHLLNVADEFIEYELNGYESAA